MSRNITARREWTTFEPGRLGSGETADQEPALIRAGILECSRLRHHRHHPTVAPHSSGDRAALPVAPERDLPTRRSHAGSRARRDSRRARAVRCRRRPALHLRHPRGAHRRRFPLRHGHGLHVAGEVPARRAPRGGLPRTDVGAEDGVRSSGGTLRESLTENDVLGTSAPRHLFELPNQAYAFRTVGAYNSAVGGAGTRSGVLVPTSTIVGSDSRLPAMLLNRNIVGSHFVM